TRSKRDWSSDVCSSDLSASPTPVNRTSWFLHSPRTKRSPLRTASYSPCRTSSAWTTTRTCSPEYCNTWPPNSAGAEEPHGRRRQEPSALLCDHHDAPHPPVTGRGRRRVRICGARGASLQIRRCRLLHPIPSRGKTIVVPCSGDYGPRSHHHQH